MKIEIDGRLYDTQVTQIQYAPDWANADEAGDIGGIIMIDDVHGYCVQSHDREIWTPLASHKEKLCTLFAKHDLTK